MEERYQSWGRTVRHRRAAITAAGFDITAVSRTQGESFLPFGNGRSYGDSCHNDAGTLIDSRTEPEPIRFEPGSGLLTCGGGVLLSEILAHIVPHGYFLPVTPGTAFVTVGGAIANDVHGKNHHVRGTFGNHVLALRLKRGDGSVLECSRTQNVDLFQATIAGMGLTGLIVSADLRLVAVSSPDIRQHAVRFDRLDDYFAMIGGIDAGHEYSVAWIDQLASGKQFGRGVVMAGDHASDRASPGSISKIRLAVPATPPVNLLNWATLKAFNEWHFRKYKAGSDHATVPWRTFFHPLDSIGRWNRLYGPRGLHQHQSVYPADTAHDTTARLLECARRHGDASFLTVLKRFGSIRSPGILSFPRAGFTLTLDFANRGVRTRRMLDALDAIVIEAGGAVNPYKDARMSASVFAGSFPGWRDLEAFRDPSMMSDFWRRTAMALGNDAGGVEVHPSATGGCAESGERRS